MPRLKNVESIGGALHTKDRAIMLNLTRTSWDAVTKYLSDKKGREKKKKMDKPYRLRIELAYDVKKRTLGQNALYWSLVTILAYEAYGTFGHEDDAHEELLQLYAPRVSGVLTGGEIPKRSKHMDTIEMSTLIEGVFLELTSRGVEMGGSQSIAVYWADWQLWRGKQGVDPLSETYRDLEDYKAKVPFCIACMRYLRETDETGTDVYVGHMAHFVSKGAGGSDEVWNRGGLCYKCHGELQHQRGWFALFEEHPHVKPMVERAFERAGAKLVEAPVREDLAEPEVEKQEEPESTAEPGIIGYIHTESGFIWCPRCYDPKALHSAGKVEPIAAGNGDELTHCGKCHSELKPKEIY